MVSKFTGWLKKSLTTTEKPSQPGQTDEGPYSGAENNTNYYGGEADGANSNSNNAREARFSGRNGDRGTRDSFNQNRNSQNAADRRRQGGAANNNQAQSEINVQAQNRAGYADSSSESPDKRRRQGQTGYDEY